MTTDPPETRATLKDVLAEAERQAKSVPVFEPVAIETRVDTITASPEPPCRHGVWDVLEGGKRLRCHYCGIDKETAEPRGPCNCIARGNAIDPTPRAAARPGPHHESTCPWWQPTIGNIDWGRVPDPPPWQITVERPASMTERDPSNLNDPALQRWVVAFAWLLTLVLLGTCVAGGACLLGAFRGDAESEP